MLRIKKMKPFKEFKEDFQKRCKDNSACSGEYRRVLESKNKAQLLKVIKDNACWCVQNKIIDAEYLKYWTDDQLHKEGIYTSGNYSVREGCFVAFDNSTVEAWGNSTVYSYNGEHKYYEKSIIRDMCSDKIYVKKGKFNIIEV